MKLFTTQKAMRENNATIIKIYYCDAQSLLKYREPFAYNSGVYGWNCDYYDIDGIIICTGYRPHGKRIDYDIVREYEQKARQIDSTIYDYNDRRDIINGYLREFIKKALEV